MGSSQDNSLFKTLEKTIRFEQFKNVRALLAISGGSDSVALFRIIDSYLQTHPIDVKHNVILAHINHQTRGQLSEQDEEFVKSLGNQFGYAVHTRKIEERFDSEDRLRNARYIELKSLAGQLGCRYLLTAHHLNDQIETILFRVFRGTGLRGLAGIPKVRVDNEYLTILRPFLSVPKSLLLKYLDEIGQGFRIDLSNDDEKFSRNFIRHEIVPLIESRFGSESLSRISKLADQAKQASQWLDVEAEIILKNSTIVATKSKVELHRKNLQHVNRHLLRQMLNLIW
ncbi:MAG: tRNA lysidine(34) synthetase TilS, partial [Planctomycetota bacterium]